MVHHGGLKGDKKMSLQAKSATRIIAALLTAIFIVSSVPIVISEDPVADVASAQTDEKVKVGWIGEFMNWNPLTVEMVSDWVAYNLIYSTLFQYDEDWIEIHNHLATGYYQVEHPDGTMSTYINISKNAYFRNADNPEDTSHPLTAEDIKFTFDLIRANEGNSWDYYLYNVTETAVMNDYQVRIDTEYTKATLIDDLIWVPILPKFQWEDITGGAILGAMRPNELIGSGAFYYEDGAKNDWHDFATAPNFHATADYGEERDIDYGGIQFQIFSDITPLIFAIENGEVDVVDVSGASKQAWDSIGPGSDLPITKMVTEELGIYDIAINAIPLELREAIGYADSGNKILLDRNVRKAIGMTLDKTDLAQVKFYGLANEADTVLNDDGFWHADLSNPLSYDPEGAKEMLISLGYQDTDADDYLEVTASSFAYTEGLAEIGDKLEFRLQVPASDPAFSTIGEAWVSMAKLAGIKFNFEALPTGPITNDQWYQCEYDLWVWSWYWGPEPLSNLACWLTAQVREGGYNCVGPICQGGLDEPDGWWWIDEDEGKARCGFDDTFDLALKATDIEERRGYVHDLQEAIYETYTEFPPLHPVGLYAFTTARFDGWGNWTEHLARTVISDMLWIWYDLEPTAGNALPVFDTSPLSVYEPEVDVPITFSIEVSDAEGDVISVNWSAGDGSDYVIEEVSGDTTNPTVAEWTHTYDTLGEYTLTVGLSDEHHDYEIKTTSIVNVVDEPNLGPSIEGLTVTPLIAYEGEETTWSVWAGDHEQGEDGEGLLFTWDWGDGTFSTNLHQPVANDELVQDEATHTWDGPGSYDVSVSVWDGYDVEDNPTHNVSVDYPGGFKVLGNLPPTLVATNISGLEGQVTTCEAIASDPDPDSLRVTWDWGDGTFSVTNHDTSSSPGEEVASTVEHEWSTDGEHPVEIWVDDGEGHNESISIHAIILADGEEAPPGSITIRHSPKPATVNLPVVVTVGASDPNEDTLTVTIDFGDDSDTESTETDGGTTGTQYVDFSHTYDEEGEYTVEVHVDDGINNISTTKDISVVSNEPPVIALASSYSFYYNQSKVIRPASISDPDGDMLTVWYDWGDESPMSMGDPDDGYSASHKYSAVGDFNLTAYADDGKGNNVSATAAAKVQDANRRPNLVSVVKSAPAGEEYLPGEVIYINVTVRDLEGDNLTVTVDFGDESTPETSEFDSLPGVNKTVEFSHAYEEGGSYSLTVSVMDDQDHSDMTAVSQKILITVEEEESAGIDSLLLLAIGLIVVAAIAAAVILSKRKGKEGDSGMAGEMEGMAPSEETEMPGPADAPPASDENMPPPPQ